MCYQTAGGGVGAPPPDPRWGEEVDRGWGGRCEWRGGTALIELTSKHFSKVSWWKRAGDGHRTSEAMCVCVCVCVCVCLCCTSISVWQKRLCVCVWCVWSGRGGVRLWGWGLSHCVREKEGGKEGGSSLACRGKKREERWKMEGGRVALFSWRAGMKS